MDTTSPIAIVTDSAAGIPVELLNKYQIAVVPYWVHMGNDTYISGQTIDPPAFFQKLRKDPNMEVHTGVPAVAKFIEIYQSVAAWARGIVSIHVAGRQSGTCNAAELAAREASVPVVVVDTETTAMAEGFAVLEAARKAKEGASLDEVVQKAKSVIPNLGVVALLESVSYALKGGRLSSAAGKVGSLLHIQPLVRVQHNKVSLAGQARRRSRGVESLIDKTVAEVGDDPAHLTVHYAEDEAEGHSLLDALKARLTCVESYVTRVPVELGVHAGPGAIGVAYYIERDTVGLLHNLEERLERLGTQAKEAIRSRLPDIRAREES